MFKDYIFTKPKRAVLGLESTSTRKMWKGIFTILSLFLLSSGVQAQTTLIGTSIGGTSVADGTFSTGATFAENGWIVANEGTSPIKWVVGTAVNSGAITGNSAYVSIDNGVTNSQAGIGQNRTVYFYKDVAIPAGETNIALSFDLKSSANSWNVYVAPTSVAAVGSDTQTNGTFSPYSLAGATTIITGSVSATTTSALGFIPASMAGTTVRLIFMWTNNTGGTNPPAAIDNIKLISRVGGAEFQTIASGTFTNPATWNLGYIPSFTDNVTINATHAVTIDAKGLGVHDLYILGTNAQVSFDTNSDQFTVSNDLAIDGSGARFNAYQGTTSARILNVGHDISLSTGGRLDVSYGTLTLNGSSLQTISNDDTGYFGGTSELLTTSNTANMVQNLIVTNTSTETPNISWGLNNIKVKTALKLNNARVALGTNKIIIGNYSAITSASSLVYNPGSGFIGGTIGKWYSKSANPSSGAINPGVEYSDSRVSFPAITASGDSRWAFILAPAGGTAEGEFDVKYVAGSGMTGVSVADGAYSITDQYNGSWLITSTDYANTSAAFSVGLYASGGYFVTDGSSRVMKLASVVGGNINGTTSPFASRNGLTLADITTGSFYLGVNSSSAQGAVTKISTGSGDWNTAGTWSPSGVPSCSDIVTIALGHTVTVNTVASAAGVTINAGGTLVNAGGNLTVGCTNNNAIFTNFGTNNVTGGTLTINGSASHRPGSTFSQTGGDIIVDSNDAGNAATSVGQGGSSFVIATPNVTLTGGKITIVDPLVNNTVATSATSITDFTMTSLVSFDKPVQGDLPAGASVILMNNFNYANTFYVGQYVTGAGIAAGTTVTNVVVPLISSGAITITLSSPTTALIATGTNLTFSAMSNGGNGINFSPTDANWGLVFNAVGMKVSGAGIPAGTYITGTTSGLADPAYTVFLSNNISGLSTSPIAEAQTITFAGASPNCTTIILSAPNALIIPGQIIGGTGIAAGTSVSAITPVGTYSRLDMTLPATGAVTAPVALSFLDGNLSSYAFAYNAATNYVAGLNHTLQIGNGVSTEKGAITTNGFLCDFIQGGGSFSLGNLTIDAPDGDNRFFNSSNLVVVQNDLNITAGSVFKKTKTTGSMYFGGNITNNGTLFAVKNTAAYFTNPTTATGATSLDQTVSGLGNFYNDLSVANATGAFYSLTINNTSSAGLTINVPNFRIASSITMTAGIIHTSSANPLYQGVLDLTQFGVNVGGNFSDTCYIDGPFEKSISTSAASTTLYLYPVGKTSYQPVSIGVTGGAILRAEAFESNSGTASANIANLSSKRWTVSREGTDGALTNFNVQLGDAGIASNNIVVQAPTDQGTYTNTFGDTATFIAGKPNSIKTVLATAGASYTGNFAYATLPNCTAVNPGNTIVSTTINKGITVQRVKNVAGAITNGSTTVELFAINNNITAGLTIVQADYFAPGTTVVSVSGTTLTLSQPAIATSESSPAIYPQFYQVSTPSTLCGTQQIALSLENVIVGNGVTYQWESSSDNVTYSPIAGATMATYTGSATSPWYRCSVTCPYGPLTVTSTPVQVSFTNDVTGTTPADLCAPGVANLEATASAGTINWYATATGGTSLATGTTYAPTISENTTYYVATEVASAPYTTGAAFAKTSSYTSPMSGIIFDALTSVIMNTVNVYPVQSAVGQNAPMTIGLYDSHNNLVSGTSLVVFTPNETTVIGTPQTVALNYNIPAGTGYKLLITNGLTSTNKLGSLYIAPAYPLGSPSSNIVLTAGATSLIGTTTDTYYNFFDMNVTDVCSSTRVAVEATITPLVVDAITGTTSVCIDSDTTLSSTTVGGTWSSDDTSVATVDASTGVVTGVSAGMATISYTITSGECSESAAAMVTVNALPEVSAASQVCVNSSITLSPTTGGTWTSSDDTKATVDNSGVVTGVAAGEVTFTFTDATTGCDATTATVTVNALPEVSAASQVCVDSSITLSPTSGGTWTSSDITIATVDNSGVVTGIAAGDVTFTFTNTTTGCDATTASVAVNALPVVEAITGETSLTVGTTTTLASTTNGGVWSSDDTAVATVDASTGVVTGVSDGTATISYTVTNSGCSSSVTTVVTVSSLSNNQFDMANFKYYPNPVKDVLNLSYAKEITSVSLYNLLGQEVLNRSINANSVKVDLSALPRGSYLVRINADNKIQTIKVVKQ